MTRNILVRILEVCEVKSTVVLPFFFPLSYVSLNSYSSCTLSSIHNTYSDIATTPSTFLYKSYALLSNSENSKLNLLYHHLYFLSVCPSFLIPTFHLIIPTSADDENFILSKKSQPFGKERWSDRKVEFAKERSFFLTLLGTRMTSPHARCDWLASLVD